MRNASCFSSPFRNMEGDKKRVAELYYNPNTQKFVKKTKYELKLLSQQSQVSLLTNVLPFAVLYWYINVMLYNSMKNILQSFKCVE